MPTLALPSSMSSRIRGTLQRAIIIDTKIVHQDSSCYHDVFTQKYDQLNFNTCESARTHQKTQTQTLTQTQTHTHAQTHAQKFDQIDLNSCESGEECTAQAGPGHQLIPTLAPKLSWPELNYPNCPEKYTAPKILIMILLSRIRSTIFHETSHQIIMHNCSLPESSLSNRCHLSY